MEISSANAVFIKDDEGIIILTDITDKPEITYGEIIYDGKNIAFLNRDNTEFFALPNVPPYLRQDLLQAGEAVVVEHTSAEDVYCYSLKIRAIEDLQLPDYYDSFATQVLADLQEIYSKEDWQNILLNKDI